jgi:hypothetical protein
MKLRAVLALSALALPACSGDTVVGATDASADAPDVITATDVVNLDAPDVIATPDVVDVPAPQDLPPTDLGPRCADGQSLCDGRCATLATDPLNCGACGSRCGDGQRCVDGACRVSCPMGQTSCTPPGDAGVPLCVSTATDRAHCGACNTACAAGLVCANGMCVTSCTAGTVACGAGCADLQRDPANCGACGTACRPGESCVAGRCDTVCPQGLTACTGVASFCADLQRDRNHCGACGRVCPDGEVCSAGACVPSCGAGRTLCGTQCVTLPSDPAHCGMCNNVCPARANAAPVCASGACAFVCSQGFADCDLVPSNGCEVTLATSAAHCGACGARCTSTTGLATCTAGRCETTACAAGRGNCDGDVSNGCEVDTSTSTAHCGACGNACITGAACVSGQCERTGVSCAAILAANPGAASGVYLVDPDGNGSQPGFRAYCDMVTEGGGWTFLATVTNNGDAANQGNWRVSAPVPNNWESPDVSFGAPDPTINQDLRSEAFHRVAGRAVMITHRNAFLLRTDEACLPNSTLRDRFAALGWTCGGSAVFTNHPTCTNPCVIARATPRTGDTALLNGVVRARLYLKAGEADGAQDTNRDRVYLSTDYRDNVDFPTGLGAFCSGSSCSPRTGDADVNDRSDAITPTAGTEFYGIWVR